MTIEAIIWVVLVLIIGYFVFRTTKSIFKAIFLAMTAGMLVIGIIAIFVTVDTLDFQKKFPAEPSTFLLVDDGKVIAGFSGVLTEEFAPDFVSKEEAADYQKSLETEDLDDILGDNYKLFIIDIDVVSSVKEVRGNPVMSGEEVLALLDSDEPLNDYIKGQLGDLPASQMTAFRDQLLEDLNVEGDIEFKGALFGAMLGTALEQEGPLLLFVEYKEGNVVIYKETAMFKFMKRMPVSMLNKVVKTVK